MIWENVRNGPDDVHVYPKQDIIDHEWESCACMPFVEAIPREDGSFGWLITHNAWDGRK
jgi:hypothetical protein